MIAAKLGQIFAMLSLCDLLDQRDPMKLSYLLITAKCGFVYAFHGYINEQMRLFNSGIGHTSVVFAIGRALKRDTKLSKHFLQAYQFYNFQLQSYRKAVDTWTLVGLRNKVVRDIRKLIGMIVWDSRCYAKYK